MALRFFRIPAEGNSVIEAELKSLLSGRKVLRVTRERVELCTSRLFSMKRVAHNLGTMAANGILHRARSGCSGAVLGSTDG